MHFIAKLLFLPEREVQSEDESFHGCWLSSVLQLVAPWKHSHTE